MEIYRIRYYVVSCTSEENQAGTFHYTPFVSEDVARMYAKKARASLGDGEGHVVIEKHYEKYEDNSWRLDHDRGGAEHIDYF